MQKKDFFLNIALKYQYLKNDGLYKNSDFQLQIYLKFRFFFNLLFKIPCLRYQVWHHLKPSQYMFVDSTLSRIKKNYLLTFYFLKSPNHNLKLCRGNQRDHKITCRGIEFRTFVSPFCMNSSQNCMENCLEILMVQNYLDF